VYGGGIWIRRVATVREGATVPGGLLYGGGLSYIFLLRKQGGRQHDPALVLPEEGGPCLAT